MCSQGWLWVLVRQPARLACPLGYGKPCQPRSTIALEQLLSRAFLQSGGWKPGRLLASSLIPLLGDTEGRDLAAWPSWIKLPART